MTFYVVKGAADACGRGCDSWIEAEGKIEGGSAARFKAFLDRLKGRSLPIYFNSPGGNLDQAILMGNMLHARLFVARIGRTLVRECGFEAQDSEDCVKLKQSGRELHGDVFTRGSLCASACPYLFAGAAVHEVAPDAVVGVHSPKIVFNFHGAPEPDAAVMAAADQRGHERADHMVAAYLARMGIDVALLGVAKTTRFEDIHILTREEIARFGLDRRELVETPWRFESNGLNMMHKVAAVRAPGETSFRLLQWRVACFDTNRFALDFQRPAAESASHTTVTIAASDAQPVFFSYPPAKGTGVEQWGLRIPRPALQSLLDHPEVELTETSLAADGQRMPRITRLSNEGWAGAMETLLATCPPAKAPAPTVQAARVGEGTAK
ncbi:MAG TPA: hypothetical protein VKY22_15520 [Bradyrhizobium sp.]|nr:hypothetical protein [Bradyrhizobium sp.]